MNDDEKKVARKFIANLDNIASEFIASFGLRFEQEVVNLSDPLMRWLDFSLRYIDPKPRKVFRSNKFPKELSADAAAGLSHLIDIIEQGKDINPYQGKGLIIFNDISGAKRQKRTDLLWADWNIIHLHLVNRPIPSGQYFSDRSEWLLFGIVGDDLFALIDVRHHDEENLFSDLNLVRKVAESWPEFMSRYEMKGVLPDRAISSEEYFNLRKGGVTSYITIGDKAYMPPGMGITTASTPTRVTFAIDAARKFVRDLAASVCAPEGDFQREVRGQSIKEPDFELCITPQGLAVYESNIKKIWLLPRRKEGTESDYMTQLHDVIAPDWAVQKIAHR